MVNIKEPAYWIEVLNFRHFLELYSQNDKEALIFRFAGGGVRRDKEEWPVDEAITHVLILPMTNYEKVATEVEERELARLKCVVAMAASLATTLAKGMARSTTKSVTIRDDSAMFDEIEEILKLTGNKV